MIQKKKEKKVIRTTDPDDCFEEPVFTYFFPAPTQVLELPVSINRVSDK